MKRNLVAVQYMEHLCTCPEHGYSQPGRYGTSGQCDVYTDAGVLKAKRGDRDCSSATSEAWSKALEGTPYAGLISNRLATYTMKSAFLMTGLFEWKPLTFMACPGDLYLNEGKHVAMCVQNNANGDVLAEFLISENGTIDGEPGDQTSWESVIRPYYDFPWDGILHYNGKADVEKAHGLCMWQSHGGLNQKFRIEQVDQGAMLVSAVDGKAVDIENALVANGTHVILYEKTGNRNQCFKFVRKGDANSPYEIVSCLNSNYCLDVSEGRDTNGTGVILWKRHGSKNQEWYFLEETDGLVTVINNGIGAKLVLDRCEP